jgi:hypothetical protein
MIVLAWAATVTTLAGVAMGLVVLVALWNGHYISVGGWKR